MLQLMEKWFAIDENQYYLTHSFQSHVELLQRVQEFVWNGLTHTLQQNYGVLQSVGCSEDFAPTYCPLHRQGPIYTSTYFLVI